MLRVGDTNPSADGMVEVVIAVEDYPAGHRFDGGIRACGHLIIHTVDAPADAILRVADLTDRELELPVSRYMMFRWSHLKLI